MSIKNALLIIALLGVAILFESPCVAGIWKDDFSDSTLKDWGGSFKSGECIVGVDDGCLNFKGLQNDAQFRTKNWTLGEIKDYSLEVKWQVKQVDLHRGRLGIEYQAYDIERKNKTLHWKDKGRMFFQLDYLFNIAGFNVVIMSHLPGELQDKILARARFEPKKNVWYKFRLEVAGNRYKFSIDNEVLAEIEDNTVPAGWVGFRFGGMINVYFDNFKVTGPDVPNGGPGMQALNPMGRLPITWGELKSQY